MTATKKNTRRAAMDAEQFDSRCFRFDDDGRKWKPLAIERRAYFIKAANAANQDGTHVEISVSTFMKAGGARATAFRRLADLEQMGACLPELHLVNERGEERELLSVRGAKVRRLLYDSLNAAQQVLDAGQDFPGHARLSEPEQRAIQRGWLCKGIAKWCEGVSDSDVKESQIHGKESHIAGEGVSDSGEGVSDSREGVSDSREGVSPYVIHNRKTLTEKPLTEKEKPREIETEVTAGREPTLSPAPVSYISPAANAQDKSCGQGKPDDIAIAMIQAHCFNLAFKTPKSEHVQRLLEQGCKPEQIKEGFKAYVSRLGEKDVPWAEKKFFADGDGFAIILTAQQKDWREGIESVGQNAEPEWGATIDAWLAENPVPAGIPQWHANELIAEAKKKRRVLDLDYKAKHPDCEWTLSEIGE
jgi:hypothetical protein